MKFGIQMIFTIVVVVARGGHKLGSSNGFKLNFESLWSAEVVNVKLSHHKP